VCLVRWVEFVGCFEYVRGSVVWRVLGELHVLSLLSVLSV